ncbi:LAFE_0G14224g1_1 [Lachancea fermentati]|uniref:LAFE_0G14224g1_1 n=1 Tax=Lachancea fermentati TaxID=4955 RepID=A0A1G4MIF7_LACFM|nr:LAFE_0G14224g1_1 [Lachancea fermentati]
MKEEKRKPNELKSSSKDTTKIQRVPEKDSNESKGISKNKNDNSTMELGERSIFYDVEWNPQGVAPFGLRNIPYNPRTFKVKEPVEAILCDLKDIPVPSSSERK